MRVRQEDQAVILGIEAIEALALWRNVALEGETDTVATAHAKNAVVAAAVNGFEIGYLGAGKLDRDVTDTREPATVGDGEEL